MRIERKGSDDAVIVPSGKIDVTNSQDLKQALLELYDEGFNNITIDFSSVTTIDSSGLGKLLLFQKKLKERRGEIKLTNIKSEYIKKMFNLIHLGKVIKID